MLSFQPTFPLLPPSSATLGGLSCQEMLNEGTAHQPHLLPLPSHPAVHGVGSFSRERVIRVQYCKMLQVVLLLSCPPGFPKPSLSFHLLGLCR